MSDAVVAARNQAPVLVLAPGRDGELVCKVLDAAGHRSRLCNSGEDLLAGVGDEVSAIVVAEESLSEPLLVKLSAALSAQPAWSDLPVLVVAQGEGSGFRHARLVALGNVSVLTRPMAVDALSSSVASSLRARRRQLQVRDLMLQQHEEARRKDEFLAMLAHELRNPLAPIRYASKVLQSDRLPRDRLRTTAELVERQVGHMARIIDDLLDVSRVTRGLIKLDVVSLDMAELVARSVEAHNIAAASKGVDVRVDGEEGPLWVNGDATRLKQVLDNLLDNAVKFSPTGGQVLVMLHRDAGQAVVTTSDHGPGLDRKLITHIFEPFFQADRSLDRTKGGLGLGLALVRGLVELHGGEVTAESQGAGTGSTFTVRIPLDASPAFPPPGREVSTEGAGVRVLVAEDNRDSAESLKLLLEMRGHEVIVAYTGPDALRAARSARPDVIICDIGLPGLSGYEVAETLRRDAALANVRMIAVTGYGGSQDRAIALAKGFDEHLRKPVEPNLLLAEIANAANASSRISAGSPPAA